MHLKSYINTRATTKIAKMNKNTREPSSKPTTPTAISTVAASIMPSSITKINHSTTTKTNKQQCWESIKIAEELVLNYEL